MEGAKVIAAVLKDTRLSTLGCAARSRPVPRPYCSVPDEQLCFASLHSLDSNRLTGPSYAPDMSGVIKLAEVLPQTKLQSLR